MKEASQLWFAIVDRRQHQSHADESNLDIVISELSFLQCLTDLAATKGVNTLTSNGPLKDPDTYRHFVEDVIDRDEAVNAIGKCRHAIARLTTQELTVTPEELGRIKAYLLGTMGEYSPYYTQLANLPVLGKDDKGHTSEQWTCNLTALAMCLNELQITSNDFAGDDDLLSGIIEACIDELRAKGYPIVPEDKILRLPDFLEFVALYIEIDRHKYAREGPGFLRSLSAARKDAAGEVTSNEFLLGLAGLFGVDGDCREAVYSWGERIRDVYEEDKKNAARELGKIANKLSDEQANTILSANLPLAATALANAEPDVRARIAAQLTPEGRREIVRQNFDDFGIDKMNDKYSGLGPDLKNDLEVYRTNVTKIANWKENGKSEILLNRPGHDVRFKSLDANGFLIDDPYWWPNTKSGKGSAGGQSTPVAWEDAFRYGYFRSYIRFWKKEA